MKFLRQLAVGLTASTFLLAPAGAEEVYIKTVKDIWGIYYNKLADGANICTAVAVYERDSTLFQFGILWRPDEEKLVPIILLTNLDWHLRPGENTTIEAYIDRSYAHTYRLNIVNENTVALVMDYDMISPFMNGRTLTIRTRKTSLHYDLTGSFAAAVSVFRDCVQPILRRTTDNPFQGPRKDPFGTKDGGANTRDKPA